MHAFAHLPGIGMHPQKIGRFPVKSIIQFSGCASQKEIAHSPANKVEFHVLSMPQLLSGGKRDRSSSLRMAVGRGRVQSGRGFSAGFTRSAHCLGQPPGRKPDCRARPAPDDLGRRRRAIFTRLCACPLCRRLTAPPLRRLWAFCWLLRSEKRAGRWNSNGLMIWS